MKRDNREGNAEGNIEEGARGGYREELREATGGDDHHALRRRGVQAFVRGGRSVGDDQEDDVEVLQVSMDPGDQVVEEVRDEVEGEVQVLMEEIGADDLVVREVINLDEEDDAVDDTAVGAQVEEEVDDEETVGGAEEIIFEDAVAQVEEEVDDEEAVGGAEEIIFEDAVGQVGVEQGDEEERLGEQDDQSSEDQAEVAEADLEDGPALSDTIDLTDSPRPNRMSLEPLQCPICLDPLRGLPSWKEVLSTPCGHLFCNTCLVTALRSAWQCPTCRRRTRAEEAIKIFL